MYSSFIADVYLVLIALKRMGFCFKFYKKKKKKDQTFSQ